MAKNIEYIIDDTFPDLSKFDGLSKEDLKEIIEYLERQEKERIIRCECMTEEEQHKEFERANREYDEWIKNFRKRKQLVTA